MDISDGEPVVSIGASLHGIARPVDAFSDMTVQARTANYAVSRHKRTDVPVLHKFKVLSG